MAFDDERRRGDAVLNPRSVSDMKSEPSLPNHRCVRPSSVQTALVRAAGVLAVLFLNGCVAVGPEQQRLVSKPNMQFSRSAVYNYSSKIMPQVLPGLATSGGAQPSTCTVCR
jgi:hypothetical protein